MLTNSLRKIVAFSMCFDTLTCIANFLLVVRVTSWAVVIFLHYQPDKGSGIGRVTDRRLPAARLTGFKDALRSFMGELRGYVI